MKEDYRPIANEEIAQTLFGEDWISLIKTIDDVFYGNYRIGATIESIALSKQNDRLFVMAVRSDCVCKT